MQYFLPDLFRGFLGVSLLALLFVTNAQEVRDLKGFGPAINDLQFDEALSILDSNAEELTQGKERLLYYMNKGAILSMNEQFKESNTALEQAWILIEDYQKKVADEALSMLTNPLTSEYEGENAEKLFVNYYKAYNFLRLHEYSKALVEVRRMDLRLQEINDKYKNENKYQRDAFIHLIMGLVYDANKEYNDAFIAYRNAYEVYTDDYSAMFGLNTPTQLKYDLIRTAELAFMYDEAAEYKGLFGIDYDFSSVDNMGDVVVFWNNGKGPVKNEASFNFAMVNGASGFAFADAETGEQFPAGVAATATVFNVLVGNSTMVKMAYPVYEELGQKYVSATLSNGPFRSDFEIAENVNAVLFQSIKDRKALEISEMLTRYVVKQLAGAAVKKGAKELLKHAGPIGSIASAATDLAVDAANVVSEKADVRNWQSLPHSIYYSRITLPEGERKLNFTARAEDGETYTQSFTVSVRAGRTSFTGVNTMDWYDLPDPMLAAYNYGTGNYGEEGSEALNTTEEIRTENSIRRGHSSGTNVHQAYLAVPSEEIPISYKVNIKKGEKAFSAVIQNDGSTAIDFSSYMDRQSRMYTYFRYTTDQYLEQPFAGTVNLEIQQVGKVRKNILVMKGFGDQLPELIETDLKHTAMPGLSTETEAADYQLFVDINELKANNNTWLIFFPTMVSPAILGLPVGFPTASFGIDVRLVDSTGNTLLSNSYYSKSSKYLSLYNLKHQMGRPPMKKGKVYQVEDPLELVISDVMEQLKVDLGRLEPSMTASR